MKIAIFHDFIDTIGGAERVALTLAQHFEADLFTTQYDPKIPSDAGFANVNVISIGSLRGRPPFKQIDAGRRFARTRHPGYDTYVVSGNWAVYAAKHHHPNLYYCHTPTRMFFDQRDATVRRLGPAKRLVARPWTRLHANRDRRAVQHCDRILANSETVRDRINRFYRREATVVHPPVDVAGFRFREVGDTWLAVSRLYPEKRIDLLLDIFRRQPEERLLVVGSHSAGDWADRYVAALRPPPNVTFAGEIPQERLVELYSRCRGLITTAADEDFGLTPVEAMASGKCVLATNEGGHRETVVDCTTGFLLPADPEAFAAKIRDLDDTSLKAMKDACIARARAFDLPIFLRKMESAIRG